MRLFWACAVVVLIGCSSDDASSGPECLYHSDCEGLCVEGNCIAPEGGPAAEGDGQGSDSDGGAEGESNMTSSGGSAGEDSSGGSAGEDSSGGSAGENSSGGSAGDDIALPSGPGCPLIGERCAVACSWTVDCLLEASALSACAPADRPAVYDVCVAACQDSDSLVDVMCEQNMCSGAVDVFRSSADVFNAACGGGSGGDAGAGATGGSAGDAAEGGSAGDAAEGGSAGDAAEGGSAGDAAEGGSAGVAGESGSSGAAGEDGSAGADGNGGLGTNEFCVENAQCASNFCAVISGGNRCAPLSNACTPACAEGRACADIGNGMGLCLDIADANEGGSAGSEGGAAGADGAGGMSGDGAAGTRYERALELADSADLACQTDCERDVVCSPNESSPAAECQSQWCNARGYVEDLGEAGVTDGTIACYESLLSLYACLLDASCEEFARYYYGSDASTVCPAEQVAKDTACNTDEGNGSGNEGGSSGAGGSLDNGLSLPGDTTLPTGDAGVQACGELVDCFNACPDNDSNCMSACFDFNPEGGALYQSIIGCAQAAGCVNLDNSIDQDCLNEECMPELEACFGPQAQPMGTLTCDEFISCFQSCPDGDDQCTLECIESTSQEGYGAYNTIISCLQDNNCFGADGSADAACLEAGGVCQTEYVACFGPSARPMGTASCSEFVGCFTTCPSGDRDCVNECIEASSPSAYAQYEAVIDCGQVNTCFDDSGAGDEACLRDRCSAEMAPCFGAPMGFGDCISLTNCLQNASSGAAEVACINASSQAGYDDLLALRACVEGSTDANGSPCQDIACAQAACLFEAFACYPDGQIPSL